MVSGHARKKVDGGCNAAIHFYYGNQEGKSAPPRYKGGVGEWKTDDIVKSHQFVFTLFKSFKRRALYTEWSYKSKLRFFQDDAEHRGQLYQFFISLSES